jgi:hypothetical protein
MEVDIVVTLPASSRAPQLLEGVGHRVLRHRWLVRVEDLGRRVRVGGVMRVLVAICMLTNTCINIDNYTCIGMLKMNYLCVVH